MAIFTDRKQKRQLLTELLRVSQRKDSPQSSGTDSVQYQRRLKTSQRIRKRLLWHQGGWLA